MSGFAGFFDPEGTVKEDQYSWIALVRRMALRLSHRGSGGKQTHISPYCALASVGSESNEEAYTFTQNKTSYHIVLDGRLSNRAALQDELRMHNIRIESGTDAELILKAYLQFHTQCAEKLEGAFSFVIDDGAERKLFLCRDRFGEKPLFYTLSGGRIIFSSEIKGLFEYPGVRPVLTTAGLRELFGFGGIRTPGCGVFENIAEIKPGHYAVYDQDGFGQNAYWQLRAKPFTDTPEDAAARPAPLTALQTALSVNASCFTFSLQNRPDSEPRLLIETAIARDFPTFGKSHLDLFSRLRLLSEPPTPSEIPISIANLFNAKNTFDYTMVSSVLRGNIAEQLDLSSYVQQSAEDLLRLCPVLRGESGENRSFRQEKFLFIHKQLPHILECMDRYSMYCGQQTQVPFVDRRQMEDFFNLPRGLFAADTPAVIPAEDEPCSEQTKISETAAEKFRAVLRDTEQPINRLIDPTKVSVLVECEAQRHTELILWLLQMNLWMNHYRIRIHF